MKKEIIVGIAALVILIGGTAAFILRPSHSPTSTTASNTTAQTNGQVSQVVPVSANPITNTSTQAGLSIVNPMVENNTDPVTGNATADRLQFTIKNTSMQTMSNLETYYTMTDTKTHKSENYYQKLTGITIAPGQSADVFFDNGSGPGHYPENKYSIYRTSTSSVDFTIELSAPGFQPATAHAQKGPGTGDTKD